MHKIWATQRMSAVPLFLLWLGGRDRRVLALSAGQPAITVGTAKERSCLIPTGNRRPTPEVDLWPSHTVCGVLPAPTHTNMHIHITHTHYAHAWTLVHTHMNYQWKSYLSDTASGTNITRDGTVWTAEPPPVRVKHSLYRVFPFWENLMHSNWIMQHAPWLWMRWTSVWTQR